LVAEGGVDMSEGVVVGVAVVASVKVVVPQSSFVEYVSRIDPVDRHGDRFAAPKDF
jgi:hypothetical protein